MVAATAVPVPAEQKADDEWAPSGATPTPSPPPTAGAAAGGGTMAATTATTVTVATIATTVTHRPRMGRGGRRRATQAGSGGAAAPAALSSGPVTAPPRRRASRPRPGRPRVPTAHRHPPDDDRPPTGASSGGVADGRSGRLPQGATRRWTGARRAAPAVRLRSGGCPSRQRPPDSSPPIRTTPRAVPA